MLWGYPALYRQFEEEVLSVMRTVDESRSRPLQVQQPEPQSQDFILPDGFAPPTVATLPRSSFLQSKDMGRQADHVVLRTPSAIGLASHSIGGYVTGFASSDGIVNTLGHDPVSAISIAAPVSTDVGQDVTNAPRSIKEEQAFDRENGKSVGTEEAQEVSTAQTPDTESSPIPPEIEKEDSDADSDWVTE